MPNPNQPTERTKDAFLADVISKAPEIASEAEAETITRAVLTTLADAVSFGQISDLMAALPHGLAPEGTAAAGNAGQIDYSAFIDKVGGSTQATDKDTVEGQARAVLTTLTRWAPDAQISDTLAQLPEELRDLFNPRD